MSLTDVLCRSDLRKNPGSLEIRSEADLTSGEEDQEGNETQI